MNQQAGDIESDLVDLGDLSHSLGFLLRMAQVQIFRTFFRRLGRHNLKPGEFSVLWLILKNPGQKQGAIAQRLNIKPAHMTKLTQKLVLEGYVTRAVPDHDRRSVRLALTASGTTFVKTHEKEFLALQGAEAATLNQGEVVQLTALLRKFTGISELAP